MNPGAEVPDGADREDEEEKSGVVRVVLERHLPLFTRITRPYTLIILPG